jgi:type II secretory pathway component PulF
MDSKFPTFRELNSGPSVLRRWWPWRTSPSQSRSLLRLIAVATEKHIPLAPLLEAWADDERGVQRHRVQRLAVLLQQGTSLPDAVEEVAGALRDGDVLAIRFGVQSGTLAASLREAQQDDAARQTTPVLRWTFGYFVLVATLFFVITTFLYVKIIPSMLAIMQDFSMDIPRVLLWSLEFASFVESYWWAFMLLALLLAWSTVSARPGRFLRNTVLSRFFGPLRNFRSAEVLEKLSVAASAGRPMTGAVSTLARYHFDPSTRRKLLYVRNEMEQGAEVWQSMAHAGLLTAPEENLLLAADRVGNRPWTLRQLAASKKRRTWRKLERLSELLLPAIVVLFGAFVLFQALSILMPLVTIITALS